MKPFVYFEEKDTCSFEGVRLRKNLKGALELVKVNYCSSFLASPDIFHVISPIKDEMIKEAKENGIKIVVSAFYGSHDASCTFFEKGKNGRELSKVAFRTLMSADAIFVPTKECEKYLISRGISCPIFVLTPGVNLSRFDGIDDVEKEIFSRYASLQKTQKYVISCGNYEDNDEFERLSSIAKEFPDVRFFYFGNKKRGFLSSHARKRLSSVYGNNISFYDLVEDDVYRSAMSGASAYLSLGNLPDSISLLEAMSAKVPVYEIERPLFGNISVNGETGWVYDDVTKIAQSFSLWCQSGENPTIIGAYQFAKSESLRALGNELIKNYKIVLNEEGESSND